MWHDDVGHEYEQFNTNSKNVVCRNRNECMACTATLDMIFTCTLNEGLYVYIFGVLDLTRLHGLWRDYHTFLCTSFHQLG